MSAIDFSRSRAILVGTSHHTAGLAPMPAAANSLTAMHALLSGPLCGWPESRITSLVNSSTRDGVDQQIATLIHDTADVLLFYYVGHGQLLDGEDLGMALVDTHRDPRMRYTTSLRLSHLRHELKYRCPARVQVVILDCCFSGLATRNTQGDDLAEQVRQITKVEGAYTLAASRASQKALYQEGRHGLTYFTKTLTEVVHDGILGAGPHLTLNDLHTQIAVRFRHLDLPQDHLRPEPTTLAVDTAEELPLAHNTAWTPPPTTGGEPPAPQPAATPGPPRPGPRYRPPPRTRPAPLPADTSATPVTFTRSRWTNAEHRGTAAWLGALVIMGLICIFGAVTYQGSEQELKADMQILVTVSIGVIFAVGALGMVAGACEDHHILTIGPDRLVIEKKTMHRSTSTTMAIRWDRLHHVSILGTGRHAILVAWTENGGPPDPSISHHDQVDSGWKLCDMTAVSPRAGVATTWEHEQRAIRDALTYFGGDKYTPT